MIEVTNWKRNENFHKGNFDRFVREIAIQAEKIQTENREMHVNYQPVNKQSNYKGGKTLHVVRKSII